MDSSGSSLHSASSTLQLTTFICVSVLYLNPEQQSHLPPSMLQLGTGDHPLLWIARWTPHCLPSPKSITCWPKLRPDWGSSPGIISISQSLPTTLWHRWPYSLCLMMVMSSLKGSTTVIYLFLLLLTSLSSPHCPAVSWVHMRSFCFVLLLGALVRSSFGMRSCSQLLFLVK